MPRKKISPELIQSNFEQKIESVRNDEMRRQVLASHRDKMESIYKANKKVYLLKKEWAKDWSYIWSEDQFNRHLAEKEIEKQSIKEQLLADKNLLEKVLFG